MCSFVRSCVRSRVRACIRSRERACVCASVRESVRVRVSALVRVCALKTQTSLRLLRKGKSHCLQFKFLERHHFIS